MARMSIADMTFTRWCWEQIGSMPPIGYAVGWQEDDGRPIGGVIVSAYTGEGGSCYVHFGGRRHWLTRARLRIVADYLFNCLKVSRIYGLVSFVDEDIIELDKRIGFKERAVLPGHFAGGIDAVLLEMKREDCRWLPRQGGSCGQKVQRA